MRTLLFYSFLLLMSKGTFAFCCKEVMINNNMDTSLFEIYKIISIEKEKNVYIIYAEKDNIIYKIVSLKGEKCGCKRVKIGLDYKFALTSYFGEKSVFIRQMVRGVEVTKDNIIQSGGSNNDLFFTPNLLGLCYLNNPFPSVGSVP